MQNRNPIRTLKSITPLQRLLLQARLDIASASQSLTEAAALASNQETARRLASLARCCSAATLPFTRLARRLGVQL